MTPRGERSGLLHALSAILNPTRATPGTVGIHTEERRHPPMAAHEQIEVPAERPRRERVNVEDSLTRLERPWTAPTVQVDCAGCKGHGKVQMTLNDLLRESADQIPDLDEFVRAMYQRLFNKAKHVAQIFPDDLLTASRNDPGSEGLAQRDRLAAAIVGLKDLYGRSQEHMAQLNAALAQAGRSHTAFWWPIEGVTRPPTRAEYEAVWQATAETFAATLGDRWKPEYGQAWAAAYDHAEVHMRYTAIEEAQRFTTPRPPRASAR